MERINTANKAVDLFGAGKHGYKAGVPGTTNRPTYMAPEPLNALQEEVAGVVEAAGLALSPGNHTQLVQALNLMFGSFLQAGAGAALRTLDGKAGETVSITDFLVSPGVAAAPGAQDNTPAMLAAEAVLAVLGGGTIVIPYPGEWRMNWVCLTTNITVLGPGGKGEYDLNCIRPYNIASPAITFGDGVTEVRYCGLERCHVSGTNGTGGAVRTIVGNAPQAMLVRGGTIDLQLSRCVIYNGVQNIALVPTLNGASITGFVMSRCHLRSDLAGQPTARNIYLARYENSVTSPNLGYLTSTKFINTRVNGPKNTDNAGNPTTAAPTGAGVAGGYVLEAAMLGNVGITVEVCDSYWDCADGAGVRLTGSSGIVCYDFQLDPGGTGRVIIETDQASKNIARYVVGNLRHGGQKFKSTTGTIDIPAEADSFAYKPLYQQPHLIGPIALTGSADPYDNAGVQPFIDSDSLLGPITLNRASFSIKTVGQGLRIAEGANAKQGLSAAMVAGAVAVANTTITVDSKVVVTRVPGGVNPGAVYVETQTVGVGFSVKSTNAADTARIGWMILEPA